MYKYGAPIQIITNVVETKPNLEEIAGQLIPINPNFVVSAEPAPWTNNSASNMGTLLHMSDGRKIKLAIDLEHWCMRVYEATRS